MKKCRTEKCFLVSYGEVERIFRGNGFHTFIADPDNKYNEERGDQQYNQKRSVLFHEQLVPSNLGRLQGEHKFGSGQNAVRIPTKNGQ